jgi:hypothetical protein
MGVVVKMKLIVNRKTEVRELVAPVIKMKIDKEGTLMALDGDGSIIGAWILWDDFELKKFEGAGLDVLDQVE